MATTDAYLTDDTVTVSGAANGTYNYYTDLRQYRFFSAQYYLAGKGAGGTGVRLTVEGTAQHPTSNSDNWSSLSYLPITSTLFGLSSVAVSSGTSSAGLLIDDSGATGGLTYLRLKVSSAVSTGTGDWAFWAKRWGQTW